MGGKERAKARIRLPTKKALTESRPSAHLKRVAEYEISSYCLDAPRNQLEEGEQQTSRPLFDARMHGRIKVIDYYWDRTTFAARCQAQQQLIETTVASRVGAPKSATHGTECDTDDGRNGGLARHRPGLLNLPAHFMYNMAPFAFGSIGD